MPTPHTHGICRRSIISAPSLSRPSIASPILASARHHSMEKLSSPAAGSKPPISRAGPVVTLWVANWRMGRIRSSTFMQLYRKVSRRIGEEKGSRMVLGNGKC